MQIRRLLHLTTLPFALLACGESARPVAKGSSAPLTYLLDAVQEEGIRESIPAQLKYSRPIERLPDVTLAGDEARAARAKRLLDSLNAIPRESLSEQDRVSAEVLEWILRTTVDAPKYYWLSFSSITPYQSPLTNSLLFLGRDMPLGTAEERSRYLARLGEIATLADTIRSGLEARAARGIRIAKPEVKQIVGALSAIRARGTKSPYAPSGARLTSLADSVRPAFVAAIERTVDTSINPALDRLIAFLAGDYQKQAPDGVGLKQYPGGEEYYRYLVRQNTTLDVKPEEIQQRGLAHLALLEHSMDSLLKVMDFKGTRKDFLASINKNPRFFANTPEEAGAFYQKYYDRIKPLIPKLFSRVPKAPAEYRRLNPALEASQTYGFYQPPTPASPVGIYFYNASNLKTRSLFSVPSIAYHELVPGHHFQIALADENKSLPALRRDFGTNAYSEGWAEYASALAGEVGLYADPYDDYGRLMSEAFLTTRLVVDPGMNLLGWSRDSAAAFMRAHTMMSESEIASETLRYSVDMPGQALGYKMGAMEFWRLRRKAEAALGPKFDLREFHALILDAGALPMSVVGAMVDRWIASTKELK